MQQQLDRYEWRANAERAKADNMQAQITALRVQKNRHELTQLTVVKNAFEEQERRVRTFAGETGPRGARKHVDVPAAETRWQATRQAIRDFEQALPEEEARRAARQAIPDTLLNEAEQAELAAARKLLEGPRARDLQVAREQTETITRARDKAAAEVERITTAGPKKVKAEYTPPKWKRENAGRHTATVTSIPTFPDGEVVIEQVGRGQWFVTYPGSTTPDSVWPTLAKAKDVVDVTLRTQIPEEATAATKRAFNQELKTAQGVLDRAQSKLDELATELGRSTRNTRRVERAQETIACLEAEDAQRLAAARAQPEGPTRLPFFEDVEQRERALFERVSDIPKREAETAARYIPETLAGDVEVAGKMQQLNEAIQQAETVKAGIEQRTAATQAVKRADIEELQKSKSAYGMIDDELASEYQSEASNYRDALQDRETARARHEEITTKAEGLRKPVSAERIVEESTKGAAPSGADLRRVVEGIKTPYEVQPLQRTIEDVRDVIRANPTGDDANMTRIEAALESHEQALANLTTDTDIKAYQLDKIIKEANSGKLAPVLKGQLNSAFRYVWDEGDVIVRKDLERIYFNIAEQLDSKLFGPAFTAFTNFFKTYATLTPGFHVRNALSALFMNASEGVSMRENIAALRLWRKYARSENPVEWLRALRETNPKAWNAFQATFASGAGGQFTEAGVSELRGGGTRFTEALFANRITKRSQRWGQDWVEGPVRLALAMNETRRGGSLMDALARVTRVHFDYSQVSKFDETMKRVIPFWTFMSRNVPLQFTQMWMKPKMYLRYQSFARNFVAGAEPVPFMPRYITMGGGLAPGVETPEGVPGMGAGMPVVLQPGLPHLQMQEDLNRIAAALSGENTGQIFSDLNPLLTTPAEYALGKDFFTGKEYGPTDVTEAKGLNLPLAAVLSLVGGAHRGPDGKMYIDDKALNAVRGLNPILDRQMRLLPQLTGTNNDRQFESVLRFLGAPVRTISDDQLRSEAASRYYDERDRQRRLAAMGG